MDESIVTESRSYAAFPAPDDDLAPSDRHPVPLGPIADLFARLAILTADNASLREERDRAIVRANEAMRRGRRLLAQRDSARDGAMKAIAERDQALAAGSLVADLTAATIMQAEELARERRLHASTSAQLDALRPDISRLVKERDTARSELDILRRDTDARIARLAVERDRLAVDKDHLDHQVLVQGLALRQFADGLNGFLGCRGEEVERDRLATGPVFLPLETRKRFAMTFKQFSEMNRRRCESAAGFGHALDSWSLSDWMTATLGELGEAANVAKKLNRVRDGIPGNNLTEDELRAKLMSEIADTFIYLDLLSQSQGFALEDAIIETFDAKSVQIGYRSEIQCSEDRGVTVSLPSSPKYRLISTSVWEGAALYRDGVRITGRWPAMAQRCILRAVGITLMTDVRVVDGVLPEVWEEDVVTL